MYGKKQYGLFEKLGLWRDRRSSFQRFKDRTSEASQDASELASELSNFASSAVLLGAKVLVGIILVALFLGATKISFLLGWALAFRPVEICLTIGGAFLLWWGVRASTPRKHMFQEELDSIDVLLKVEEAKRKLRGP